MFFFFFSFQSIKCNFHVCQSIQNNDILISSIIVIFIISSYNFSFFFFFLFLFILSQFRVMVTTTKKIQIMSVHSYTYTYTRPSTVLLEPFAVLLLLFFFFTFFFSLDLFVLFQNFFLFNIQSFGRLLSYVYACHNIHAKILHILFTNLLVFISAFDDHTLRRSVVVVAVALLLMLLSSINISLMHHFSICPFIYQFISVCIFRIFGCVVVSRNCSFVPYAYLWSKLLPLHFKNFSWYFFFYYYCWATVIDLHFRMFSRNVFSFFF